MGMTTAAAVALSQVDLGSCDLRLPVASSLMYIFCRPAFAMGYLADPLGVGRVPGLMIGGFYYNMSALTYAGLVGNGIVKSSKGLGVCLYVGVVLGMLAVLVPSLKSQKGKKLHE